MGIDRIGAGAALVAVVMSLSCNPPKTQAEACRRQAAGNRIGRSFSKNSSASADALEDLRCDEIEREERHEAREDRQREEDRKERERARQELLATASPSVPAAKKCSERAGHFFTKYRDLGGNCGERKPERMDIARQPRLVSAPCTGKILYSDDNCSVHYEVTCPALDDGTGGVTTIGDITWTDDGTEGEGEEAFAIDLGDGRKCQGTYGVSSLRAP